MVSGSISKTSIIPCTYWLSSKSDDAVRNKPTYTVLIVYERCRIVCKVPYRYPFGQHRQDDINLYGDITSNVHQVRYNASQELFIGQSDILVHEFIPNTFCL